jgi:5-methylcytosine-specific restriction endonuclease McrA
VKRSRLSSRPKPIMRDGMPRKDYVSLVKSLTVRCRHRCENPWCRSGARLDPHHVIKRSQGGLSTPSNLTMLCRPCHDDTDRSHDNQHWLGVEAHGHEAFTFAKWMANDSVDFPRQTTYIRYRRTPA